ncbi:MAG TPA: NAD-dependent deacylase, partial [Bacteroidetes bacterium]|nr:NAD-dependent deacylase [Bacteroidota bacterium]
NHDIMEVASPQGWVKNKKLVLDFYNQRRGQLHEVSPNDAHKALVDLEKKFNTVIITQNVDNLHEKAGSKNVYHLHGELFKVRSTGDENLIYEWKKDLNIGDKCEKGFQLRPHIVWFGEQVPMLPIAAKEVMNADIMLIVGTSMQVYPAAGLVGYLMQGTKIFYIDPNPHISYELERSSNLEVLAEKASTGVRKIVNKLLEEN